MKKGWLIIGGIVALAGGAVWWYQKRSAAAVAAAQQQAAANKAAANKGGSTASVDPLSGLPVKDRRDVAIKQEETKQVTAIASAGAKALGSLFDLFKGSSDEEE